MGDGAIQGTRNQTRKGEAKWWLAIHFVFHTYSHTRTLAHTHTMAQESAIPGGAPGVDHTALSPRLPLLSPPPPPPPPQLAAAATRAHREICVSAPGKVILFGEHAVVYGKVVVMMRMRMLMDCRLIHSWRSLPVWDSAVGSSSRSTHHHHHHQR